MTTPLGTFPIVEDAVSLEYGGHRYDDLVPVDYLYDPMHEDIRYGDELSEGMVVLLADDEGREAIDKMLLDSSILGRDARLKAITNNRWCRVYNIRLLDDGIVFLGLYSDGRKIARASTNLMTWVVRLDSVPLRKVEEEEIGKTTWMSKHFDQ